MCVRPGGARKGAHSRPQVLLRLGRNRHALAEENGRHLLRRPRPLGCIIDRGERLQRNRSDGVVRQRSAEVVPVAVAVRRERRRPDRHRSENASRRA
jgi:hypothetical protein